MRTAHAAGTGQAGGNGSREAGRTETLLCVQDAEALAASCLPAGVRDFIAGGSDTERTQAANRAALDEVGLVPRVLADVSACVTSADLIGCAASMPVAVAPMAYQRMAHADGESGLAAAALAAGVPFTAALLSSTPVEQIAALGGCVWLQLYWLTDRGLLRDIIRRAEAAGCRALMLTVDVPRLGRRLRDLRNGFAFPDGIFPANLRPAGPAPGHSGAAGSSVVASHTAAVFDPSLSWPDLDWLREQTALPLVLKGILDPRDADRAAGLGIAGIVVSNHGGRQLDGAVASVTALPWIADAVAGRCQVLLDSGIRSGTDVLRALALGASGVLLGRPALWGLAMAGRAGATQVLSLLQEELTHAMTLAGCADLASARALRTQPCRA